MKIEIITELERLFDIELAWDELYKLDPASHIYLSSKFMSAVAMRVPHKFRILTAWDDAGSCIGLLPILVTTRWSKHAGCMYNVLDMLGHVFDSDYTGILCDPAHAPAVCAAFGHEVSKMDFGRIILNYFNGPAERLEAFLNAFDAKIFDRSNNEHLINDGKTNNLTCPSVDLPDSFEAYLNGLSSNSRQKLRRLLRQLDNDPSLRITRSRPETYTNDVNIIAKLWYMQYAEQKGRKRATHLANLFKDTVMLGLAAGMVHVAILWRDGTPVAAQANYIDPVKQEALFHVGARDESIRDLSAGLMLQAHSIRWAIAVGLKRYDFTIGDEPYKYSFGAVDRKLVSAELSSKTHRNHTGRLDPISREDITRHIGSFVVRNHLNEARIVAQQAIEVWPDLAPDSNIEALIANLGAEAKKRQASETKPKI